MLNPLVLAALVALIKAVADAYFPQFPISEELIYTLIVALFGLFGVEVVKAGARKYAPSVIERGLLADKK